MVKSPTNNLAAAMAEGAPQDNSILGQAPLVDNDEFPANRPDTLRVMPADVDATLGDDAAARRERAMRREEELHDQYRRENMGPLSRIERLEALARQYFGTHHFDPPVAVVDPEAARKAARERYTREMEEIDAAAASITN